MKVFRLITIPAYSVVMASAAFFGIYQSAQAADVQTMTPQIQRHTPISGSAAGTQLRMACPDLKVSLTANKSHGGSVTLNGTVTNIGNAKYDTSSVAEYYMNLSYPPKSYNQIGVSEQLCTKTFKNLQKGASFAFNCTFNIPDFSAWSGAGAGDAKRLFSLRAIKSDMSPFTLPEDCNPNNNGADIEVEYRKK